MLKTAQILRRFAFDEWGGTENSLWNSVFGLRSHNIDSQILSTTAMAPVEFEERGGHRDPAFPLLLPVLAALEGGQAPAGPPRRQPGIPSALPLSAKHGFRPAARAQLGPDRRNGPRRREAEKNSVHRKLPPRLPADAGEGAPGNGTPAASHLLLRQIHRAGPRLAPEFHFRRPTASSASARERLTSSGKDGRTNGFCGCRTASITNVSQLRSKPTSARRSTFRPTGRCCSASRASTIRRIRSCSSGSFRP